MPSKLVHAVKLDQGWWVPPSVKLDQGWRGPHQCTTNDCKAVNLLHGDLFALTHLRIDGAVTYHHLLHLLRTWRIDRIFHGKPCRKFCWKSCGKFFKICRSSLGNAAGNAVGNVAGKYSFLKPILNGLSHMTHQIEA